MHFHLPKPLHGWREFAGEVGIIVIGVLIALSAEQVVEHFHDRAQLHDAEARMTAELRDDDLPQAFARTLIGQCNEAQLDDIEKAVESGDRTKVAELANAYEPPFRSWDDQAWKMALSSQALSHADADRMIAWSVAYLGMPLGNEWTGNEQAAIRQLRARNGGIGPLSVSQQDRLFQLIADLRAINKKMTNGSGAMLQFGKRVGVEVTAADTARITAEARRIYGACAADPAKRRPIGSPGGFDASPWPNKNG